MTGERSKAVAATPKQVDHLAALGLDRGAAGRLTRGEASAALAALRREGRASASTNNIALEAWLGCGCIPMAEGETSWRILLGKREES